MRFALWQPAGWAVGVIGVASLLGACGSGAGTASGPPAGTGTRPQTSTPKRVAPTTAAPPTTAVPVTTTPPTTAAPVTVPPTTVPPTTTPPPPPPTTAPAPAPTAPPATAPPPTTAAPAPPGGGQVQVLSDCQTPEIEPTTIILACGDGSSVATAIHWTTWGPTSATGTAVIRQNLCNPNCAQGGQGSFPASITLSEVEPAGSGGPLFSMLTASFSGASPTGTPSETYSLGAIS